MSFTIGSLFSGSGGFELAATMCGGTPVWASEVEPFPIAVTWSRFPGMKHLGSVTDINGGEVEPVDVVSFGSPCQDLSVAGKRAGLKHEDNGDEETTRSGLFMEAVRIIKEMRRATNGVYPRFAIWENVPGAFSSNKGEDFRTVLEELIKIVEPGAVMPPVPKNGWPYADCYCGEGWSLAYRTFDAQYWGVPQRRRRIYLVLDLTDGSGAGKVLFEREGVQGYFAEGRTPWQGIAADAERSIGADDREGENDCIAFHLLQDPIPNSKCSPCMGQGNSDGGQASIGVCYGVNGDIAGTLDASYYKGCGMRQGVEREVVAVPICMATQQGGAEIRTDDKAPTVTAAAGMSGNNQPVDCYPNYVLDDQGGQQINVRTDGKSPTLRAEMHGNVPCVMDAIGFDRYNQCSTGNVCETLRTPGGGDNYPTVVYSVENHPADSRVDIDDSGKVQTLTSRMGTGGGNVPMVMEPVFCSQGNGIDRADTAGCNGKGVKEDISYTLNTIDRHAVVYACSSKQQSLAVSEDIGNTLGANDFKEPQAVAYSIGNGQLNQISMAEQANTLDCMHDQQAVIQPYQDVIGALCSTDYKWVQQQQVEQDKLIVEQQNIRYIVRRLTPTECARLQGFADRWAVPIRKDDFTDEEYEFWCKVYLTKLMIDGKVEIDENGDLVYTTSRKPFKHKTKDQMLKWYNGLRTDSSEYKLWGNGIALPNALYVMQGIADVLNQ